jgi:hypothetical protein
MPLNHVHLHGHKLKRPNSLGLLTASVLFASLTLLILALHAGSAYATSTLTAADEGGATYQPTPATAPGLRATIASDGRTAIAPAGAPLEVQQAIWAANKITRKPYIYGGGHSTFKKIARGYDCSGTVSFSLGNAGFIKAPLDSSSFMKWGDPGKGAWITVYTNPGHAYAYIAGLRLDTSGPGESGPRWRSAKRSDRGFRARHPEGF